MKRKTTTLDKPRRDSQTKITCAGCRATWWSRKKAPVKCPRCGKLIEKERER